MEVFKPFVGYTYFNRFEKSNNFSRYVCPYNFEVLLKEKSVMFKKKEHNIFNFKEERQGKLKLKTWIDDSVLVKGKSKAFYIYEISYKISGSVYSFIGIVGALKLPEKEYDESYVFCCEETLNEQVQDNFDFLKNCGFSSAPICALYEGIESNKILNLIKSKMQYSYVFKAKQNNVVHKIWKIDEDEALESLIDFFKGMNYYIVGGVEKYEAALKYRNYLKKNNLKTESNNEDYIMTLLFPKSSFSFTMLPVHRIVSGMEMFDGQEILNKSSKYFNISSCKTLNSMRKTLFNFRRQGENAFGLYADDCYNVLSLKDRSILKEFSSDFSDFDVFIVDEIFLKHILNISDDKVSYVVVDTFASYSVDCGKACFAVILSAIRSEEFFSVVEKNKKFFRKSFSFFPKPVEGLLFYVVD